MTFEVDKNIFGLDVSDRTLRLAQLKRNGKKLIISSYNEISIPAGIIECGEIKKENNLIELIDKLIKTTNGGKITTKEVIAVLPETKTFIKVVEITSVTEEELPGLIKEEIKNHIPFDLEEIYLDWQILEQNRKTTKLLIGTAPKYIVDSYYAALEKSGLVPYILEIEAAAIIRSLLTKEDQKAKIIIDFGAVRTGLIVYDHNTIQFTVSLPISGNKITETISTTLNLDLEKAEKAKIICGLDQTKCEGALLKILMSAIDNLVSQIKKSIIFYQTNFPKGNPISEVIICGGGANFSKIDQVLSEKINLPVKIGNPLVNITQTKKLPITNNKALSYTTALGLALRAFEKNNLI